MTLAQCSAVIERYQLGIDPREVTRFGSSGNVHAVYKIGEQHIVKVPKNHPRAIAETRTASVAVPAAAAAGVRTGNLVAFDDSGEIFDVPFAIYEYVRGDSLAADGGGPSAAAVWHTVGRELAALHLGVREVCDPHGWLEEHARVLDHGELLSTLVGAGILAHHLAEWFAELLDSLKPAVLAAGVHRRFVHGDAKPANVLQVDHEFGGLIDWDDAGWFDPVIDFAPMPLRVVDQVLAGYRSVSPIDGDDTAEQRILWDHITVALIELWRLRLDTSKIYYPSPGDGLAELLALVVEGTSALVEHLAVPRGLGRIVAIR
jgi:Ser/Thr protein kinase RdoA (MazF antagonist)